MGNDHVARANVPDTMASSLVEALGPGAGGTTAVPGMRPMNGGRPHPPTLQKGEYQGGGEGGFVQIWARIARHAREPLRKHRFERRVGGPAQTAGMPEGLLWA